MKKTMMILLTLLLLLAVGGCKDDDDELPSSHTVNKGGALHASGLNSPEGDCTSCHGGSLTGGDEAPSCYECHGQKWD